MIESSLLKRQLRRLIDIQDEEALQGLLLDLKNLTPLTSSTQAQTLLAQFSTFLAQVDQSYLQSIRDLELSSRSLEISSQELNWANKRLATELSTQQEAISNLQNVAKRLAQRIGANYDISDNRLDAVTRLLSELVDSYQQLSETLKISEQRFQLAVASAEIGIASVSLD